MKTRGVLLIAHNSKNHDYFKMANFTAARASKFLNLPVSVITDADSVSETKNFDKIILQEPNKENVRGKSQWINKNRYLVYELTPYDDTLVLDVDYVINSNLLLKAFLDDNDFVCHKNTHWIFETNRIEYLHPTTVESLWATVMRFQKTSRAKQIFDVIKMVQDNYEHYANIYKFLPYTFRNDYALAIGLKTVNGHLTSDRDYFSWNLVHVNDKLKVIRESDTEYIVIKYEADGKNSYIKVKDFDFHMLNKKNFIELIE